MKTYQVTVWDNGDTTWEVNNRFHREDGPALERTNGDKFWYQNDELHREDGPAVEYADGTRHWYINGKKLTEAQFNMQMTVTEYTVEEIQKILGYKIKIVEG